VPAPAQASPVAKLAAQSSAEICQRFEPGEAAAALVDSHTEPHAFLSELRAQQLYDDAYAFLAHGLPAREAILWCRSCVREACPEPSPPEQAALDAVDQWLDEPSDELRRAAMQAAETATFRTPAGCCALAIFFSDGSIAPPDCPSVPPPEGMAARTVASTVALCGLSVAPDRAAQIADLFVARGVEIASGPAPWESPPG
jgi:hypothetical protein